MEILISILTGILLMELYAWLDPLAKWLVERVAEKLPDECQAAFEEQFMADLAAFPNSFAKVYFAFRNCTMAAQNINEEVRRARLLALADTFEDLAEKVNGFVRQIDSQKVSHNNYDPFISTVKESLARLRGLQQQDDREAKIAIDRFQALSSPVVDVLSTIQVRLAEKQDLLDRLREDLVRNIEIYETIRRRILDENPLKDNTKLWRLFEKRIKEMSAVSSGHMAALSKALSDDVPTVPHDFSGRLKAISEAHQSAAQAVKRSKQKSA
jgi:hypothetical protein